MNIMFAFLLVFQSTSSPAELYNQANMYYEAGNYEMAIDLYEKAVAQISNARLYYNLGNAYFKTGRTGRAIANYQRAKFLTPRDRDISHNLEFARNYRADKVQKNKSPITELLSNIFHYLSMYETQMFCSIFFLISSILISLYIIYRKDIIIYSTIISAALCLFFFINGQVWLNEKASRHAVIIAPEVNALSGPGEDYKEIIVLHSGTEVRIKEIRGDYALIQLPGGVGGWIKKETTEEIF